MGGGRRGVDSIIMLPDDRIVSYSEGDGTIRVWNITTGDYEVLSGPNEEEKLAANSGLRYIANFEYRADGRLLSRTESIIRPIGRYELWSLVGNDFRKKTISEDEYDRLYTSIDSRVAPGYSLSGNWVVSESFGRVYVDGPVQWVVKVGDVIVVFQENGRDHWYKEVSN